MSQQTYRAAVIGDTGHGNYGHGLDFAFFRLPRVEVVAVADPDETARERAQARIGAGKAYADYRQMLEEERPDVVAVCPRWPDQHEAIITAAVHTGAKGIFCEKPLAGALDVADRLLAACDARGAKVQVAHQNRARPAPAFVREQVQQGKIGRLRLVRTFGKSDHRSGGEDMLVLGSHLMDLMRFFAGDARWVHARVAVDGRDATLSDVAPSKTETLGPLLGDDIVASFGFDHGVTGTFESTCAADGGGNDYYHVELCGTAGILAFWSDPATPVLFLPRPFPVPGRDGEWQRLDVPEMPPGEGAPPSAGAFFATNQALTRDLLAAIEQNRPPINDGHNARAALELILAVYASHLAGARVTLPLADRSHPLAGPIPALVTA
jgi:predicted dehydrogenase